LNLIVLRSCFALNSATGQDTKARRRCPRQIGLCAMSCRLIAGEPRPSLAVSLAGFFRVGGVVTLSTFDPPEMVGELILYFGERILKPRAPGVGLREPDLLPGDL